jgi:hypothetical protein
MRLAFLAAVGLVVTACAPSEIPEVSPDSDTPCGVWEVSVHNGTAFDLDVVLGGLPTQMGGAPTHEVSRGSSLAVRVESEVKPSVWTSVSRVSESRPTSPDWKRAVSTQVVCVGLAAPAPPRS